MNLFLSKESNELKTMEKKHKIHLEWKYKI